MVLSIAAGSSFRYLLDEVGASNGNYYSADVQLGEPAGQWRGSLAAELGLSGEVRDDIMEAVYGHFIDPRDARIEDREQWDAADTLGKRPYSCAKRDEILAKLVAAEPDPGAIEPERLEQLTYQAAENARSARPFFDLTYSPPKSVTVLYVACKDQQAAALEQGNEREAQRWEQRAQIIEKAVWDASGEMIRWMEQHAGHSRISYSGGRATNGEQLVRYTPAGKFVVASFLQHTSRPVNGIEAPQLHVHNAVLNKVLCEDGKWRSLDSKALFGQRGAASALADREVMATLTREFGTDYEYDPRSKSHEIKGVGRDVRDVFSPRRQAVTKMLPSLVEAFTQRHGREPNALELTDLSQRATLYTRKGKLKKADATTLGEKTAVWAQQVRDQLSTTLGTVATAAFGHKGKAEKFDAHEVIANALSSVQEVKTEWTKSDLMGHMQRYLPSVMNDLTPGHQGRILREMVDLAVRPTPERAGTPDEILCLHVPDLVAPPAEFRMPDGTSAFTRPDSATYTTARVMQAEELLKRRAQQTEAIRLDAERTDQAIAAINERMARPFEKRDARLGADQAAAIRGVLSSGADLETITGPAGTGKSFAMGKLAEAWELEIGGRVFGLADAENAARVLQDEGLANTANITRWLMDQQRLDDGDRYVDAARWGLQSRDLIIVDEANMGDSLKLSQVVERAQLVGAKVVFVQDHRQLTAVGPGGASRDVAEAGNNYELTEVRRFRAPWEREASLRLRDGDTSVVAEYDAHGRIEECADLEDAYTKAINGYMADVLAGKNSYLVTPSNEMARDIAVQVRAKLVEAERVEAAAVPIGHEGLAATAGIGDVVQARKNDHRITDMFGQRIANRALYEVIAINQRKGTLTVRERAEDGELGSEYHIPARYATQSLSLSYAMTAHGAEGKTGDTSHAIITPAVGAAGGYVPATRGRELNRMYVVDTDHEHTPDQEPRRATDILAQVIKRDEIDDRTVSRQLADSRQSVGSMPLLGHRLYEAHGKLVEQRFEQMVTRHLGDGLTEKFLDDDARYTLYRLMDTLDRSGMDAASIVSSAIHSRELASAESVAQVVYWRVHRDLGDELDDINDGVLDVGEPTGDTYTDRLVPDVEGEMDTYARKNARLADARVTRLGDIAAETHPEWAVSALGPVPDEPLERLEWSRRAGTVGAYREQYNLDGDPDIIGRAPGIEQPMRRGEWYAAWRALGRPDQVAEEQRMTHADLTRRIEDYEYEKSWAPQHVAADLRSTSQARQDAYERSQLLKADAATLPADDPRRIELFDQANAAAAAAAQLGERERQLTRVHETRGEWYLETDDQRRAAEAAARELQRRDAAAEKLRQQRESDAAADAERERQQLLDRSESLYAEAEAMDSGAPGRAALEAEARQLWQQFQAATEQHIAEIREAKERAAEEAATEEREPVEGQEREPVDVDQAVATAEAADQRLAAYRQLRERREQIQAEQRDASETIAADEREPVDRAAEETAKPVASGPAAAHTTTVAERLAKQSKKAAKDRDAEYHARASREAQRAAEQRDRDIER